MHFRPKQRQKAKCIEKSNTVKEKCEGVIKKDKITVDTPDKLDSRKEDKKYRYKRV